MEKEIFGGQYIVSDEGRIFSMRSGTRHKLATVFNEYGYEIVILSFVDCQKTFAVHRLVALSFLKKPADASCVKYVVVHKDLDKSNNNVDNLMWLSVSDAHRYARDNKTDLKNCKITREIAEEIRESDETGVYLADKYGVTQATISKIKNFKNWK